MNVKFAWPFIFNLILLGPVWAQFTLKGFVYSGERQEPLPFATVFLSGTTKGTLTDETGHFEIKNLPDGTFDLIVSYTGFITLKTRILTQQEKAYRFILKPLENQLDEVTVKARRQGEQGSSEELAQFIINFIGITSNAKQCRLLNPKVLIFTDSPTELIATAAQPLLIENQALGYHLKYYLDKFSFDYAQQRVSYQGHPLFELLTAKNSQQGEQWKQNRKKAYQGSLMHFMRSLYQKRLVQEGFVIQAVLEKKDRSGERRFIGLPSDSTVFFSSLTNVTKKVAYPMASYKLVLDTLHSTVLQPIIKFTDWLQVIYTLKREPSDYQRYRETPEHKYDIIPQRSFLRMLSPSLELGPSGRFDLQGLLVEGYWTWELMADGLPIDYEPEP